MQPVEELRFPVGGGYRADLTDYGVSGERSTYPAALAKVEAACTPPTSDQVEEWLVLLQVATAGARRSEEGMMVTLGLYLATLRQFPADVAKGACEHFATKSRWFPVLADVVEWCERAARPRFLMRETLRRAVRHA